MFAAENMIHLKGKMRIVLVDKAVFAEVARTLEDETAQPHWNGLVHAADFARARLLALALARLMT